MASSIAPCQRHYWGELEDVEESLIAVVVGAVFSMRRALRLPFAGSKSPRNATTNAKPSGPCAIQSVASLANPRPGHWRIRLTKWHVRLLLLSFAELARTNMPTLDKAGGFPPTTTERVDGNLQVARAPA